MIDLLESIDNFVTGTAETAGSVVERLSDKRVGEMIDPGVSTLDHMANIMGIPEWVEPETHKQKQEVTELYPVDPAKAAETPQLDFNAPTIDMGSARPVDVGAFRRKQQDLQEAMALVEQAHANPDAADLTPYAAPPQAPVMQTAPESEHEAQARQMVDQVFADGGLDNAFEQMGYHDQASL